jgi:hypothetical protein
MAGKRHHEDVAFWQVCRGHPSEAQKHESDTGFGTATTSDVSSGAFMIGFLPSSRRGGIRQTIGKVQAGFIPELGSDAGL